MVIAKGIGKDILLAVFVSRREWLKWVLQNKGRYPYASTIAPVLE
jgi:hypothetical protein